MYYGSIAELSRKQLAIVDGKVIKTNQGGRAIAQRIYDELTESLGREATEEEVWTELTRDK